MPDTKLSDLTAAGALDGTELVYLVQAAADKKAALKTAVQGGINADKAQVRADLDLEVGTDFLSVAAIAAGYQPLDGDLTSWAAVARAAGLDTFVATPSSANLKSVGFCEYANIGDAGSRSGDGNEHRGCGGRGGNAKLYV